MNCIKVIASHKVFETYYFNEFEFMYDNVKVSLSVCENKLAIILFGKKSTKKLILIFDKIYDLMFLLLGGFPKRESVIVNDIEIDTSKWVRK